MSESSVVLMQARPLRLRQRLEITPDHRVMVTHSGLFSLQQFALPLAGLNPVPVRIKSIKLKPLIFAIPIGIFAAGFLIGSLRGSGSESAGVLTMGIAFAFLSLFCLTRSYYESVDALVFAGAGGRIGLWFNSPNRGEFNRFVAALESSIEAAQAIKPEDKTLAGEIQKLKDLLDRGLLDKDQFESAKNRLTGNETQRRVGF